MREQERVAYCCKSVRGAELTTRCRTRIEALHERESENLGGYLEDVAAIGRAYAAEYGEPMPPGLPWALGDMNRSLGCAVLAKCRPVSTTKHTLLPLNRERHWTGPLGEVAAHDVPWSAKAGEVVWRGASTGAWVRGRGRLALVARWAGSMDVGVSRFVQGVAPDAAIAKAFMPIREQLRYRFVVSAEGNDVGTNLAWALASNSVVLMPRPRYETWLMEGRLRAGVHYVLLRDDFSDLGRVVEWCRANGARCRRISGNATAWVRRMMDPVAELRVAAQVVRRFVGGARA